MIYPSKKPINKNLEREIINIVIRSLNLKTDDRFLYNIDQIFHDYFDEFDQIACVMEIENHFEIQIYSDDAEEMTTIRKCCDMLRDKYIDVVDQRAKKLRKISEPK